MSKQGAWCDNIIIQAVANALNCIIHITESNLNSQESTVITPVVQQEGQETIFIGYINGVHYVSTLTDRNSGNNNRLKCLKRKLLETNDEKKERLLKQRQYKKNLQAAETTSEKSTRLARRRDYYKKKESAKSSEKRQEKLPRERSSCKKRKFKKNDDLQKMSCDSPVHEQNQVQVNMNNFHKSNKYSIFQCTVCSEAWPLKSTQMNARNYQCSRCTRDKQQPKKFSKENNMIPSVVPLQLQGLTQIEEMLIARALPIMRIYVKPGGQRGYSGHCINLPQNVAELANSLPRYPKDLSVIVVKMKGKDNSFKDVTVRRKNVANALQWLIDNNPRYKNIIVNGDSLNCLPENGVPPDLLSVETESTDDSDTCNPDLGLQNEDEIVYNGNTEMSSFLPIPDCQQKEIEAVREQLSRKATHIAWPTVDNEPINEYLTPFLATLAFPTLFPDGKGDPTNPALHRDLSLGERVEHLLKFGEYNNGKWQYRFASHPRFAYWALNMIQRKRILQQTGMFLKQNPGEAHFTSEELRQMAANNDTSLFMSKVSRYLGNITGSNAY